MTSKNKKNLMVVAHRRRASGLRPVYPVAGTARVVARLWRRFRIGIRALFRIRRLLLAVSPVVAIHCKFILGFFTF